MRPRRGAAGFTLVELLVALTLLGLISVALFGGLRFGARAWQAGAASAAATAEIEAVQRFLRQRLERAVLPRTALPDAPPTFVGGPQALRFVAPLPAHLGVGGLHVLDVLYRPSAGELVLDWQVYRPEGPLPPRDAVERNRRLLDGVAALALRYFGQGGDDDEPAWHGAWDPVDGLPLLVELDLAFAPGDRRTWPRLTVALHHGGF